MTDDVPRKVKHARREALMRAQARIVARRHEARTGDRVQVMVDGTSPDAPLVVTGRLEGQAPDIDSIVYLDRADSAALQPGQLVAATITGANGYDLIADVG
jgi:tRNA A37 methylthiotransferase MiaB